MSSYTHLSPWVYNSTFPDKITGTQELSGAILSGGSQLVSIQGMVLNGDTTDTSKRSNVYNSSPIRCSGTTYWLKGTAVDNGLVFGNLSAGQYYTLVYLDEQFKFSQDQNGEYELTDRVNDPEENVNLLAGGKHPELLAQYRAKLLNLMLHTAAKAPVQYCHA